MRRATLADFGTTQRLGITGFPSLLLRDGDQTYVVTRGYAPFAPINEGLGAFLTEHHPLAVSTLVCDLDRDPC
jgi:protein-disulfide isomerase-like protein with CxxC motif